MKALSVTRADTTDFFSTKKVIRTPEKVNSVEKLKSNPMPPYAVETLFLIRSCQTGSDKDCFHSSKPGLPPLKEGAIIQHEVVCCALPGASCGKQMISRRFAIGSQSSQGTLHFPCSGLRQLPFCGLASWKQLALQAVSSRQVYDPSIPKNN